LGCALDKIKEVHSYIESRPAIPKLALTILAGIVIACISLPINILIGAIAAKCIALAVGKEKYEAISKETPLYGGKLPSAFSVCIAAPIIEECVFRGMIQPATKTVINFIARAFCDEATAKKIATVVAIIFTSLLFGAAHFINSSNLLVALPQVICATYSGIVFGLEKEFGGGLLESTAHHMTNNTIVWVLVKAMETSAF
jgi:membrane protease YdiL (CAAX protease family)